MSCTKGDLEDGTLSPESMGGCSPWVSMTTSECVNTDLRIRADQGVGRAGISAAMP
jgi:hypothetical protein